MSLQSPLGKVLGRGSAKDGVSHWWGQRVSASALIVLTLWFVYALLMLPDMGYAAVFSWLQSPLSAVLLSLLIIMLAYHSQLGVQVVIEDYVASKGIKIVTMLIVNFVHVLLGALGVFAVLRVAFGGAA
jgi:succinate dehydrogenase / fumarate reductase, membrane anchor subunit